VKSNPPSLKKGKELFVGLISINRYNHDIYLPLKFSSLKGGVDSNQKSLKAFMD
jgi:hypothetical protein